MNVPSVIVGAEAEELSMPPPPVVAELPVKVQLLIVGEEER